MRTLHSHGMDLEVVFGHVSYVVLEAAPETLRQSDINVYSRLVVSIAHDMQRVMNRRATLSPIAASGARMGSVEIMLVRDKVRPVSQHFVEVAVHGSANFFSVLAHV